MVVWLQFTCISFVRLINLLYWHCFEKVYKALLPMKKHSDTVKGNLVSPVRKLWLPLLLWFCLSWVLLLHLQIKSLLQILEDFHLFGESLCSIFVPCARGDFSWPAESLLYIFAFHIWTRVPLFERSFFLRVLFSGFCVLQITAWIWVRLVCLPSSFSVSPPPLVYCQLKWKILHFLVGGSIYCIFCPVPVLRWRSWMTGLN